MVWQTGIALALKHLAGRHDQLTHAPKSSHSLLDGEFLQGKTQRIFVAKTKGGGKVTIYGDQAGVDTVKEILDTLPSKAVKMLEESKQNISFWYEPEYLTRQSSKNKILGQYSFTPITSQSLGQHRVVFSSVQNGLEEFGHMLDKELGLRSKRAGEYSLNKKWQSIRNSEGDVVGHWLYKIGLATEDFAKTFRDYIQRPDNLQKRYPKHYTAMQELFGD